jgi:Na+-driven multidrug efflux pump
LAEEMNRHSELVLCVQLGLGLGLAIAALYACASPVLPGVFSSDADVTALTSSLLPLAVAMVPLNALMYVLDGILVGASDFKYLAGENSILKMINLSSPLPISQLVLVFLSWALSTGQILNLAGRVIIHDVVPTDKASSVTGN